MTDRKSQKRHRNSWRGTDGKTKQADKQERQESPNGHGDSWGGPEDAERERERESYKIILH